MAKRLKSACKSFTCGLILVAMTAFGVVIGGLLYLVHSGNVSSEVHSLASTDLIDTTDATAAISSSQPRAPYSGTIHMDWPLDADRFSYINYKSLESVLCTYPSARVVVTVIAPAQAHFYGVDRVPPRHLLDRYSRLGYPLETRLRFQQYGREASDLRGRPLGATYWNRQMALCCQARSIAALRTLQTLPCTTTSTAVSWRCSRGVASSQTSPGCTSPRCPVRPRAWQCARTVCPLHWMAQQMERRRRMARLLDETTAQRVEHTASRRH